jgi:uncharacterized protein (TIGR02687 family)
MKTIGYEQAKKELINIFNESTGERKIIFWYDPTANFKDDIDGDIYENARVLVYDRNPFEVKHIIEIEDKENNILVYFPNDRPKDADNWLLDILLYAEPPYFADTIMLTMRRLEVSSADIRRVISAYSKFFDSNERIEKLKTYVNLTNNTSDDELKVAMLSVLVNLKTKYNEKEDIIKEVLLDNDLLQDIKKFGLDNYFWEIVSSQLNYAGEQSLDKFIKTMFTTAVMRTTNFTNLSTYYQQYLLRDYQSDKGSDAERFIHSLMYYDRKRYISLQEEFANSLSIKQLLSTRAVDDVKESDIFEDFDKSVIEKISNTLNTGGVDYDFYLLTIEARKNTYWHDLYDSSYRFIANSIRLIKEIDKQILEMNESDEYIKEYINRYYLVDTYYRKACVSKKEIDNPSDDLSKLYEYINNIYQTRFLDKIGGLFSASFEKKELKWSFFEYRPLSDFYVDLQRVPSKKKYVIISDALRYEVAMELVERLKQDDIIKGKVEPNVYISPLPSITKFGMASTLPNKEITYKDKQVYVDGKPTNSTLNRDKILKDKNVGYAAISYNDINDMNRNELRKFNEDKSIVYIYHDAIDNSGEHDEKKTFKACEQAIDEIVKLVKKLYNNLQISNYVITADHGFIYRDNGIEPSDKYSDITKLKCEETNNRYLISEEINIPNTLKVPLNYLSENNKDVVVVPYSYDVFKTQGGGQRYLHGGASLQEIIVPSIIISDLRTNKSRNTEIKSVGVRLKSLSRKETNRQFPLIFEQTEKVEEKKKERVVKVWFEDINQTRVSDEYQFVCDSTSDSIEHREKTIRFNLNNIQFDRNQQYFLVMWDVENNELIEKHQFQLDILQFKAIF